MIDPLKSLMQGHGVLLILLFLANLGFAEEQAAKKKKDKKPAVEGTFQFGSKTFKIQHGMAYKNKQGDQVTTEVYLTEKRFPSAALKSLKQALKANGNDDEFTIFDPFLFIAMRVDGETDPSINVMLPDGGGFNITKDKSSAKLSGDRIRGRAYLPMPQTVFGKQYRLDVKFDLRLLQTDR